jgi:replication factor C subunit 3/5
MSDYEDDMDIDAPAARDEIMFNSDNNNSKGKRSAANLPVEAEDSLPWYVSRVGQLSIEILNYW